jgi:hypothetical protein
VAESHSARFVFEHTRIESFPDQIGDGKVFVHLMEPLEASLAAVLPAGSYELIIAVSAASRLRRNEFAPVRAAIERWAVERAPNLAMGPNDDHAPDAPWSLTERPAGVPFDVTLQRTPRDDRVVVFAARFSPPDVESARKVRVDTAFARKCPKLAEAKREFAATSVLTLESDDIALANRHSVNATVMEAIRSREDVPDIILLVETDRGLAWQLWVVKEGDRMYPDLEDVGPFGVPSLS